MYILGIYVGDKAAERIKRFCIKVQQNQPHLIIVIFEPIDQKHFKHLTFLSASISCDKISSLKYFFW